MACTHPNPSSYRFCGVCGELLPKQACRCGHASQPMDFFCGQCGKQLAESAGGGAAKPVARPTGKYDLALLISRVPKTPGKSELAAKQGGHLSQDAIRRLLAAKKQKA